MNKFRTAFQQIKAEEELKSVTYQKLMQKRANKKSIIWIKAALATVLCLFVFGFGLRFYQLEISAVSYISIDINPSFELTLNQQDNVIAVSSFNNEAQVLLSELQLEGVYYTEAVDLIVEKADEMGYLSDQPALEISVISNKESELMSSLNNTSAVQQYGASCHSVNAQYHKEAQSQGMSFGKYQAYLEWKELDPNVTVEHCQQLSMNEIREGIRQCHQNSNQGQDRQNRHGNCNHNQEREKD